MLAPVPKMVKAGGRADLPYRRRSMLCTRTMPRWTSLFVALLLVFSMWTGSVAHAAEELNCDPVAAEAMGHYEGDTDQVPADPETGVAHHHAGCSGHQVAAELDNRAFNVALPGRATPFIRPRAGLAGLVPDAELRPPIA